MHGLVWFGFVWRELIKQIRKCAHAVKRTKKANAKKQGRSKGWSINSSTVHGDFNNSNISTLTTDTTWRLRFSLNSVPTSNGKKVGELFVVDVQFEEEEGYEPPQGTITQVKVSVQKQKQSADSASTDASTDADADASTDDNASGSADEKSNVQYLKVKGGRWKLSEDPEDRKDGLWIWGLFQEPL